LPDPTRLPLFSATLALKFRLLTPLLSKDDDPFHLFDNPVRRDHIFGLPYLAAASVKGLAADAYQRAFRIEGEFSKPAKNTQEQQTQIATFRRREGHALRLFGLADDGAETGGSQAGRLHFSPVWFNAVQYLIMNPTDAETGLGKAPIQFEAIAPRLPRLPRLPDGAPVEVDVQVFYCNPAGAPDSDEATVRADLARWLAAVAAWWPALGLGAKRLAGYGAIQPVAATCAAHGWSGMTTPLRETGPESWMNLAKHIAKGA
jgi:CRISPR-associated protein Cmr2